MPERILVVDDEESIVRLVSFNLRKEGCAVIEARDGDEAVSAVDAAAPDLVRRRLRHQAVQPPRAGRAGAGGTAQARSSHDVRRDSLRGPKVFTRETLLDRIWGYDYAGDTRIVDVHVSHIREKTEKDPRNPAFIKTIRGIGYKFGEKSR